MLQRASCSAASSASCALQVGYPAGKLEQRVALLGGIPWTTVDVEEAQGSTVLLHRFPPFHLAGDLAARTMLHQGRRCFISSQDERLLLR